jgi:hypothetical protein
MICGSLRNELNACHGRFGRRAIVDMAIAATATPMVTTVTTVAIATISAGATVATMATEIPLDASAILLNSQ